MKFHNVSRFTDTSVETNQNAGIINGTFKNWRNVSTFLLPMHARITIRFCVFTLRKRKVVRSSNMQQNRTGKSIATLSLANCTQRVWIMRQAVICELH